MSPWGEPSDARGVVSAPPAGEPDGDAGTFRAGDVISGTPYRVRRLLGEGGHAAVYECDNGLGKGVAVKVLHRHLAARPDLAERMAQEARRTAWLRHPNIVRVHVAGTTTGDRPRAFIEMELLQGSNGRQLLLLKERIEVAHALDILIDLCHALDAAHGAGLVHRDLKPDNLFIHFDPWMGRAVTKLLDFGIARAPSPTRVDSFEGTLAYAAPEQLHGAPVTAKSDLYSLGVIAFELITGQRPFEAAEAEDVAEEGAHPAGARVERHLWNAILTQPPPPPGDDLRLPRALKELLLLLLDKDPTKRPESARSVANTLRLIQRSSALPGSRHARPGAAPPASTALPFDDLFASLHPSVGDLPEVALPASSSRDPGARASERATGAL